MGTREDVGGGTSSARRRKLASNGADDLPLHAAQVVEVRVEPLAESVPPEIVESVHTASQDRSHDRCVPAARRGSKPGDHPDHFPRASDQFVDVSHATDLGAYGAELRRSHATGR